jgi:hypothetical protein
VCIPDHELRAHSSQTAPPIQGKNKAHALFWERCSLVLIVSVFVIVAVIFRNPYFGQWDSFDYVTKMVQHRLSDLALGRPLFLAILIVVWETAHRCGAGLGQAAWVAQMAVLAFAILGLLAFFSLLKGIIGTRLSLWGTAWLAATPLYVVYSGSVMTEVPSLACLISSVAVLVYWLREPRKSWLLLSAVLFAASVHMREQTLTAAAVFPLLIFFNVRLEWRQRMTAILIHAVSFLLVALTVPFLLGRFDTDYWNRVQYWMSVFHLRQQGLLKQLLFLIKFALANSLVAAAVTGITFRFWSKVLPVRAIVFGMGLLPMAALLTNSDLGIQPRYEFMVIPSFTLAGLVGLQMVTSVMTPRARHITMGLVVICQISFLAAGLRVVTGYNQISSARKTRVAQLLATAPSCAVFVGGAYTPILEFYQQTGLRPNWRIIRSGWEWKKNELAPTINRELLTGQPVFFLSGEGAWDYLQDEKVDINSLKNRFDFVPVNPGMERIERK